MKCHVCGKDYTHALRTFSVQNYNRFYVHADVFTAEALSLIFDYAQLNQLDTFTIDADESKIIKCAGCQELNIYERMKRRDLLNLPEFGHINRHDFF